jgi:LPS export ABC transporter protein LptC
MAFSRKLARGLVLLVAFGMAGMLVVAVLKGTSQKEQRSKVESEPSDAEMKITEMEYVEMQEGRKFYVLKASEARYLQEQQKTILKTVRLTFFMENGEETFLNSEEGVFYSSTKNIELYRAVEAILPGGYRLASDRAVYEHEKKTLLSDTPITMSGPDIQLKGGPWKFLIPERKGLVDGGVQAKVVLSPTKRPRGTGR